MKREILVYDIETFYNLFTVTFYIRKTKEYKSFIIHDSNNQFEELIEFLFSKPWIMVGFNNENFDYPVIHHMINHKDEYLQLNGDDLAKAIYKKAQSIINEEFTAVWDSNKHIPQLDLFKIWHFQNPARKTSLKALEVAMNLPLVEDMPVKHDAWIYKDQIQSILDYNYWDVYSTAEFLEITIGNTELPLYKGKNKIELRQELGRQFSINCLNFPDVKLGEELMLQLYCREVGKNPTYVKTLRTIRKNIALKDCIPFWCNIRSKEFNEFLTSLQNTVIFNLKGEFSRSVIFHGIKFDFGQGGCHASIEPGVYSSDDKYILIDGDVNSLYPSIAEILQIYPEHLDIEFIKLYSTFIHKRLEEKAKPKKEQNKTLIEGYKLILNSVYGKTNEETSFLYDPLYTMKTTIAGQLFIAMWSERLVEAIPELVFISVNTDGICIKIPKEKESIYYEVCDRLTKETSLTFEYTHYDKYICKDVNNYFTLKSNGEIKYKGLFEIDKELHKDPSAKIIPIALKEYFINKKPIQETIRSHKNIYDFCLRLKTDSRFIPQYHYLENNEKKIKDLTRTTRYYISNHGGSLVKKKNHDGNGNEYTSVNKGFVVQLFNKFEERENYNINYSFYITECEKIIDSIENKQLNLFY